MRQATHTLKEANDLTQADLMPECGTASIVSEVLSSKRRLPADVFTDAPAAAPRRGA